MSEDLHGKVVRTFLVRLLVYTAASIVAVGYIAVLMWAVHTYNIPTTLVVPAAIFLLALITGVWFLLHDTKQQILDEHRKDTRPRR